MYAIGSQCIAYREFEVSRVIPKSKMKKLLRAHSTSKRALMRVVLWILFHRVKLPLCLECSQRERVTAFCAWQSSERAHF